LLAQSGLIAVIRGSGHALFDNTSPPNAAQKQRPQAAMAAWGPCFLLVARGNQISYHSLCDSDSTAEVSAVASLISQR